MKMTRLNRALAKGRKTVLTAYAAIAMMVVTATPVHANTDIGNIIDSVISFLSWGVGGIGGFLAIFGIVTLGIGFSGDNASEKQKGIIGLVGGIIVIGAAILIGTIGSTLISAPTF